MERGHAGPRAFADRTPPGKVHALLRIGLVVAVVHFFVVQFAACIIVQEHGWSIAFTGFYWLVNGFLLAIALLHAWKPHHPLAQVGLIAALLPVAYSYTRFFGESQLVVNPGGVVASVVMAGFLALNLVAAIAGLVKHGVDKSFLPAMARLRRGKVFAACLACTVAWTAMTAWSYVGFSQVHVVRDFHQESFSMSFWGSPSGGTNASFYSSPEGVAEMQRYQHLNASFYNTININVINNPAAMASRKAMLDEWAAYNISVIYDITPLNPDNGIGDFVSYYYLEQMNDTIRALMDWMDAENVTNVRGISFDVEGPKFGATQPVSPEQYRRALVSYQGILDEFKERFPGKQVHLIQMEGIMFDFFDGDVDLDIALKTVSVELDWDWFGFMTYHVGPSPTFSSYRYATYLQAGTEQFGARFQPWVGWWYDVNVSAGEVPEIDRPGVYERSLEHVKIAKATGAREVVLAPVRTFYSQGRNSTIINERLDDLIAIKNGFETFTIPVTNNMRLFTDTALYWDKIVPQYLWVSNDVVTDLMLGTPGGWFELVQWTIVALAGIGAFLVIVRPRRRE